MSCTHICSAYVKVLNRFYFSSSALRSTEQLSAHLVHLSLHSSSSHFKCEKTRPLTSHPLPPLTATTAQNNVKFRVTAAIFPLPKPPSRYSGRAEMLLTSLAVSLNTLREAFSKSHFEDVVRVFERPLFRHRPVQCKVQISQVLSPRPLKAQLRTSKTSKDHDLHHHARALHLQ